MKRKHFLALAHAVRRMFLDPTEVRFVSAQREAIIGNLVYFGHENGLGEFSEAKFRYVIEHGREMDKASKLVVDRMERMAGK